MYHMKQKKICFVGITLVLFVLSLLYFWKIEKVQIEKCIVKKVEAKERGAYLEKGKCAHIILEADNDDDSIMEEMFVKSYRWAEEQQISFCGIVYIFIRFVKLEEQTERNFYEVWIPIKE